MATVFETTQAPLELGAGLQAGTETISYNQTLTFVLYKRLVLPIDGFVFWVKASLVNTSIRSLYNMNAFNKTTSNQNSIFNPTPLQLSALQFNALGSLHYSQEIVQEETTSFTRQHAVFTSTVEINELGAIAPDEMYITTLPNGAQLAFNDQNSRFYQAGLWHYSGRALFSALNTQIVDSLDDLNMDQIVSNSLPFWLAMSTASLPIFPSFLSPKNFVPPFITVDIQNTQGFGNSPLYLQDSSQSQLVAEDVTFVCWGLNNNDVLDFQTLILNGSYEDYYGIGSVMVPIDNKYEQSEFTIIAQKKTMILRTNYYQVRSRDIAMQTIKSAMIDLTVADLILI